MTQCQKNTHAQLSIGRLRHPKGDSGAKAPPPFLVQKPHYYNFRSGTFSFLKKSVFQHYLCQSYVPIQA
jgi:hypothetical protein